MSKSNLKNKFLSLLLVMALVITMVPINVFASESTDESVASCDEGVHDFTVEKYDESNHWYECSICGVADELLCHYYDENGDTICNGCSYERSIIEEISIDKILMSEGETATITLKAIEGYTAKWIYFYKPITNNTETVYLYLGSDNTYEGSFSVDDQTESGIWKVKSITLKNAEDEYVYLYNSNNYTGTYYDKEDLSSLNFEVTGTNADIVAPVIESYSIDKTIVSAGEKVTITVQVTDEHLPSSFYFWYKNPSSESEYISMKKIDSTGLYQGVFSIDSSSEIGVWKPYYFTVSDTNDNETSLYNSKVTSYGSNKADLSSLNFEVVEVVADEENESAESFIVKFTDGYGNTLSTQRVNKGEAATEPETPTHELYLFNGWDSEFTNVTANKVINATWVLNPNIDYDKDVHIGNTFTIEVYSTASQTYTITCNEDVAYTSSQIGSSIIFTDQMYYAKEYEIQVDEPGSYLFYVKGSKSSNTLTYKVKITDHNYADEWTIDKEATCTEDGSKYRKCTFCAATTDVTTIEKLGHDYADEWTVDKAVTCTEDGSKSHHCSRCDATTDVTTIEKLGHDYADEWTVDKAVTCTEDGSKSHHCSRCDATTDITTIEKLGHDYGSITTVAATCEDDGYTKQTCNTCKYVKYTTLEAKGHHIANTPSVTKKSTTSQTGKLTYKCKICGDVVKSETIPKISTVKLSSTAYTYDGKKKTPSIVIKDSAGNMLIKNQDYTLSSWKCETGASASSRKAIGKYLIKVTFKGKYSGSKTLSFTIGPKNPKTVKVVLDNYNNATLSWSKVSGVTGYKVYWKPTPNDSWHYCGYTKSTDWSFGMNDGVKNTFKVVAYKKVNGVNCNNEGKTTSIYSLKKITGVKVAKSGTKVKVSWTNIPGETGYQISKSTSKTGTKVVATYATTSGKYKTVSATKGKTYYYKVRAYKVVDGKKIYGPWSSVIKYKR